MKKLYEARLEPPRTFLSTFLKQARAKTRALDYATGVLNTKVGLKLPRVCEASITYK